VPTKNKTRKTTKQAAKKLKKSKAKAKLAPAPVAAEMYEYEICYYRVHEFIRELNGGKEAKLRSVLITATSYDAAIAKAQTPHRFIVPPFITRPPKAWLVDTPMDDFLSEYGPNNDDDDVADPGPESYPGNGFGMYKGEDGGLEDRLPEDDEDEFDDEGAWLEDDEDEVEGENEQRVEITKVLVDGVETDWAELEDCEAVSSGMPLFIKSSATNGDANDEAHDDNVAAAGYGYDQDETPAPKRNWRVALILLSIVFVIVLITLVLSMGISAITGH